MTSKYAGFGRAGASPRATWLGGAASVIFGLGLAFAGANDAHAITAAGTSITNRAAASFTDTNSNPQTTFSNSVTTVVGNAGSFVLTTSNIKMAAAGGLAYAPHTLQNTGNFADTFTVTVADNLAPGPFSALVIYPDASQTGSPSGPALCTATAGASCNSTPISIGPGSTFSFVAVYTLPPTATTPVTPASYDKATVSAVPTVPGANYAAPAAQTQTDTVMLTTGAAFSVAKAIALPGLGVNPPAGGTGLWPAAVTGGLPSPAAGCSASWPLTNGGGCSYTTYTLTYQNNGAAGGDVYISDTLGTGATAGLTYVDGSAVWSGASGTGLASNGSNAPAGLIFSASPVAGPGTAQIQAVVTNVPATGSGTLTFAVLVNSSAAIGVANTSNTAVYSPGECGGTTIAACSGSGTSTTNTGPYTVLPNYGVVASSIGWVSGTPGKDATPGAPVLVPGGDADNVVLAAGLAGGTVSFTDKITNTGNATDTFNLTMSSTSFPAGTIIQYLYADGVTPLNDTNRDGILDTGPLTAGASVNVVIKVTLPPGSGSASPVNTLLLATSVSAPAVKDAVYDILSSIVAAPVDLTNTTAGGICSINGVTSTCAAGTANTDVGQGTSSSGVTTQVSTTGGTPVGINLFIKNNDSIPNTYAISAAQTSNFPGSLPAGWSVNYQAGPCPASLAGGAATYTTPSVATGNQVPVCAVVTPPAGTLAATYGIWFQAKSTAVGSGNTFLADILQDAVQVTNVASKQETLQQNNQGQAVPNGTVAYPHTVTNTGNTTCGNLEAEVSDPSGWGSAIYLDVNNTGVLQAGDTLLTTTGTQGKPWVTIPASALAPGTNLKLLVQVFAPAGATVGAIDTTTLTVKDVSAGGCPIGGSAGANVATDITTVSTGELRLDKWQANDDLCNGTPNGAQLTFTKSQLTVNPAKCVLYQIQATNQGASSISMVNITDGTPGNTVLAVAPTCKPGPGATGTWNPASNGSLGASATPSCGCTTAACNISQPNGTATMTFSAKVN